MAEQPLGAGGAPTDILTGRPLPEKAQQKVGEAQLREKEATQEANLLLIELAKSPYLALLAEQLERRMVALANADPECQTLVKIIRGIRDKLDAPMHLARNLRRQTMGVQLSSFADNGPSAAP